MSGCGADYYVKRAAQERAAASAATDARARELHLELAQRYEEAARGPRPANDGGGEGRGPYSGLTLI